MSLLASSIEDLDVVVSKMDCSVPAGLEAFSVAKVDR